MRKLVSNITHELKMPLAIISSQVELLQYEYDDTKGLLFSSILDEIDKMSLLISSILQNSRMETASNRLPFTGPAFRIFCRSSLQSTKAGCLP